MLSNLSSSGFGSRVASLAALVVGLLVFSPRQSRSATIDVCPGVCTYTVIQDAINAASPGDVIQIGAGSYDEHLVIVIDVTLQGEDAATTSVHVTTYGPVIEIPGDFFNRPNVTINDLTIAGGRWGGGGGITSVHTALHLNRVHVTGNESSARGGGIECNFGSLTIRDSEISHNIVTQNSVRGGGGIFTSGPLMLIDSTVRDNSAPIADGGGLYLPDGVPATITGSTIHGNFALANGGGIWTGASPTTVVNSTISGNRSSQGGGIYYRRELNIIASTMAANEHVFPFPAVGVGLFRGLQVGRATLYQSILFGNVPPENIGDCEPLSSVESLGYNVVGIGCLEQETTGDQRVFVDQLGPLQDNGGPTWTHAPLAGSAAVDRIPSALCATVEDQRGVRRPRGGGCDSGAFEQAQPIDATIDFIIDEVEDLVDRGLLTGGQGNALTSKLAKALASIDKGNSQTAINQLGAFINQVEGLVASGQLTPEQGASLIALANQAIALLS